MKFFYPITAFSSEFSPTKYPRGFKVYVIKNTFVTPSMGMNSIIPMIPHTTAPNKMASMVAMEFSFTLDPVRLGVNT